MPKESVIIVEDIPMNPVLAAIASVTRRTEERCDLKVEIVDCPYIARFDNAANPFKLVRFNSISKFAREALAYNLSIRC